MKTKRDKVMVAMSGGVDSSVAAKLLKGKGVEAVGVFLHFWKENLPGADTAENKCCSVKALLDARRVSHKLEMPLYTFNFDEVFKKEVVDDFLDEYAGGRTPNPCVRCNKRVKLGLLLKKARGLGFDYVASGHYAKIKKVKRGDKTIYKLFRATDKEKDQSYFLYTFNQDELAHLLFPLENLTKPKVRRAAKQAGLPVAEKKESQEICFIAEKSHNEFLKRHLKLKKGPIIILESGQAIGEHQGLPLYTIGQRKGVEIGGTGPFYVVKLDYSTNALYVAKDGNDQSIFSDKLTAKKVNWISGEEPQLPLRCEAVIRYRHKPVKCVVTKKGSRYLVEFAEPQRAITPGQSVVFYKGDEVLGGGIIV